MSKESATAKLEEHPIAEVDRIRDIIMGAQMRQYEQQFKRITAQLDQLGKQLEELRAALNRQQADQEARTLALREETQQRQSEQDRMFSNQIGQLQARLEKQGGDLTAQLRDQATEMRRQGQELRSEFGKAMDALENEKASRDHVGELLMEMGTRLKQQTGIADLLGQLGKAADAG